MQELPNQGRRNFAKTCARNHDHQPIVLTCTCMFLSIQVSRSSYSSFSSSSGRYNLDFKHCLTGCETMSQESTTHKTVWNRKLFSRDFQTCIALMTSARTILCLYLHLDIRAGAGRNAPPRQVIVVTRELFATWTSTASAQIHTSAHPT